MAKGKKRRESKRGINGEGSVWQRPDGRYGAALYVETLGSPGRKRVSTTKSSREEAAHWLTAQKHARNTGVTFDPQRLTFGEYLERWLEDSVRGAVKDGTYLVHRTHVRRHLVPVLGETKLAKITAAHFQALYRQKIEAGLSAQTVLGIHSTARKALKQAVRWDLVPSGKNAAALAIPPRPKKAKIEPLTAEQAKRLIATAREQDHRLLAMYVLALSTGARHGELLALRWEDVTYTDNPPGAEIAVRQTLTRSLPRRDGGTSARASFALGTPKTGSARVISVGAGTAEALREHAKKQKEERLAYGPGYTDSGHVFTAEDGSGIYERKSAYHFRKLAGAAGMPEIRFHDLRHTAATLALTNGVAAKVVQEMLGHATISQTLDTYSHVMPTLQREAAAKLDSALF